MTVNENDLRIDLVDIGAGFGREVTGRNEDALMNFHSRLKFSFVIRHVSNRFNVPKIEYTWSV
jgi:hypothetical protein